ncbi:Outer membrane protein slp precursor [Kluyvera cryocrescens]|uniref:Outer membrane protein slp n=1 Tax=Kluyvera cryocrescens TaxID=580 RepID=A0A485BHS6_KLUCR|nr:Outer membrane protein slp precursor [Kluyvera cryocrescens]
MPDAIQGSSPTPQQDLVRVMSAPQLYVGQESRFGGTVVGIENQQGHTRLEIATVPLDSGARPTLGEASRGRIYADVNGFLDPVDYRGQLVTVVARSLGRWKAKSGPPNTPSLHVQATGYKALAYCAAGGDATTADDRSVGGLVLVPWNYGYGGWGWYNTGPAEVRNVVTE